MKLEDCTGCPYSRKTIPHTKPVWLCSYGRYKDAPGEGFPCAWIKKCEHHENVANNVSKPNSQHSEPNCNIMLKNPDASEGNVKGDDK